jgi:DNA-binding MarR family transcriptional regulator
MLCHTRRDLGLVSELAEEQSSSHPAISQAADVMVSKHQITRTQDTHDRRHIRLDLTPAGNTLLDAIFNDTRKWMKEISATLSDEELQTLIDTMSIFKKVLSA